MRFSHHPEDPADCHPVSGGCTIQESIAYRKRLKTVGGNRFLKETIHNDSVTARKLITAFGIRPPPFLDGLPDHTYYPVLELAICRELSKREKLLQYNTIDDAVTLLKSSRNIIILTGAGISTSLGIPDFRSKDTGLYSQLEHLGLSDPQEVFDIHLFREDPSIFYSVAKDILPSGKKFSPTHAFIRLLQDKNKLLTNFTQNIDNLEGHAGISSSNLIQCHGSFATATCIECRHHVSGDVIYHDLKSGLIPRCDACLRRIRASHNSTPTGSKRKRCLPNSNLTTKKKRRSHSFSDSDSDEDDNIPIAGVMKPDITFFGEDLPSAFHKRLLDHDRDKVDLVLVIGTSLKVAPVSEVVGVLPKEVPQIYINRDPCGHVDFDVDLLGECDVVVKELCRRAGWDLKHEMLTEKEVCVEGVEGWASRWHVRVEKPGENAEHPSVSAEKASPKIGSSDVSEAITAPAEQSSAEREQRTPSSPSTVKDSPPVDRPPHVPDKHAVEHLPAESDQHSTESDLSSRLNDTLTNHDSNGVLPKQRERSLTLENRPKLVEKVNGQPTTQERTSEEKKAPRQKEKSQHHERDELHQQLHQGSLMQHIRKDNLGRLYLGGGR